MVPIQVAPLTSSTPGSSPAASSASPSPAPFPVPGAAPTAPAVTTMPVAVNPALPTIVLIDAFPSGVDPAAAAFVTEILRQTLTTAGHSIVPTALIYDAARRLALPFPPPPDGIGALLMTLQVPVAVTCEVRGGGGYYQAMLRVRFASEPVERIRQIVATQWTLGDSLRQAVAEILAPTSADTTSPYSNYSPPQYSNTPLPDMTGYTPTPPRRPSRLHRAPFELSIGGEFAIGPGTDSFWNFLAYGRAAWFPVDRFGVTASVGYANLRGRSNRVANALFMVGVETAIELLQRQHVYLPLRAEVGYLPFNGPVVRLTAALAVNVTRSLRLEFDLLSPTVWVLPGGAAVSMDLGAQVIVDLGAPARHRRRRRVDPVASEAPASEAPERPMSNASPSPTAAPTAPQIIEDE